MTGKRRRVMISLRRLCACVTEDAGDRLDDIMLAMAAGMPSYELCPGGADVMVDQGNLVQYIQAVVDATLGSGIDMQMNTFRAGFNEVSVQQIPAAGALAGG